MKKLLYFLMLLGVVCLAGCSKETTYVFTDNSSTVSGLTQNVRLIEYDANGSKVAVNAIDDSKKGTSKEFVADEHAEKVVCQLVWKIGTTTKIYYMSNVFYLDEGGSITIELDDHSLIGSTNPI